MDLKEESLKQRKYQRYLKCGIMLKLVLVLGTARLLKNTLFYKQKLMNLLLLTSARRQKRFTTTERVYIDDKDITKGLIEDGVSVKKRSFDQIYISLWLKGEVEVMICEFVKKSLDKATFIDCLTSYWRSQDAVVPEVSVDLVKMSHYVEKPWVITTSSEGFSIIPKEVELNPIPIPFAIVKRITLYSQGIL